MQVSSQLPDYEKEIKEILNGIKVLIKGTHAGFRNALEILEMEYDEAIQRANLHKEYQIAQTERLFELETLRSKKEYQQDYEGLQEEMMERLEDKKRRVKDEYENEDEEFPIRKTARLTRGDDKRERRQKKNNGASLVFLLKEGDINEDVAIMRRDLPPFQRPKGWGKRK